MLPRLRKQRAKGVTAWRGVTARSSLHPRVGGRGGGGGAGRAQGALSWCRLVRAGTSWESRPQSVLKLWRRAAACGFTEEGPLLKLQPPKRGAVADARIFPKGSSPFQRHCQKQKKKKPVGGLSLSDSISLLAKLNKEPDGRGVQEMKFTQALSLSSTQKKVQVYYLYWRKERKQGERRWWWWQWRQW